MAKSASPNLHKAIRFAVKAHKKQDRDGEAPLPYVTHPIDVVNILRYEGGIVDADVLCAAALHDTLEETEVDAGDIEKRFGTAVAALVKEVTREEPSVSADMSEDQVWKLRTSLMLAEIDRMSDSAKRIKLADRISNLKSAAVTKQEKYGRYLVQSRLILEHIPRSVNPALWDKLHARASAPAEPERNGAKGKPAAKKATPKRRGSK